MHYLFPLFYLSVCPKTKLKLSDNIHIYASWMFNFSLACPSIHQAFDIESTIVLYVQFLTMYSLHVVLYVLFTQIVARSMPGPHCCRTWSRLQPPWLGQTPWPPRLPPFHRPLAFREFHQERFAEILVVP